MFSPFEMDRDDSPPLWTAINERRFQDAQELIKNEGASLDDLIEEGPDSLLHRSAREGDTETVTFFVDYGCSLTIETFDYLDETPLIGAAGNGHLQNVVLLLSARANPNANCEERIGNTAIREAVRGAHLQVVELLLKAGADPRIKGWMGISALDQIDYKVEGGIGSKDAVTIRKLLTNWKPAI